MRGRRLTKLYFKIGTLVVIVFGLIGYAYYQSQNLRDGPQIIIESPENGALVNISLVEIKGTAKNITYIALNDRQIFIDEDGKFSEKLLLSYGYNIMKLSAKDKFGRTIEKRLELVYK